MLKFHGDLANPLLLYSLKIFSIKKSTTCSSCSTTKNDTSFTIKVSNNKPITKGRGNQCFARRRVRYEDEGEEENNDGYNPDIALLESYSEAARSEALLVKAIVDGQEEQLLIFKGFSSSLSYTTNADPSRSVVPSKAIITSIDIIKGPFDPSNIEYIEKGLTWETFLSRLQPTQ